MATPVHILLQTTIPSVEDDWGIERFSLLRDHLTSIKVETGASVYKVTARNRETNAMVIVWAERWLSRASTILLITTWTRRRVVRAF